MRRRNHMVLPQGRPIGQTGIQPKCKTPGPPRNSRDDCLRMLNGHQDWSEGPATVPEARKTLGEIAGIIQSAENRTLPADYDCILRCLLAIFPALRDHADSETFADAAADYAVVVEMVYRKHPELDSRQVMGQLLELTSRLFSERNMAWKTIYRHLLSVSRALHTARPLNRLLAADIHQWMYAGVRDLFAYRERLAVVIDETRARTNDIENAIHEERNALARLETNLPAKRDPKISIFEEKKRERRITGLMLQHRDILEEENRRTSTLALLDCDIREFETRLRDARRTYIVRPV